MKNCYTKNGKTLWELKGWFEKKEVEGANPELHEDPRGQNHQGQVSIIKDS